MIPAYNCSDYLIETLESVLAQDLGADRMQIEVIDDASTDTDVEALVKQIGKGRVTYHRQRENVGSLRNFETCLNRARGHLVHLLHGDDRVLKGFYLKFTELFDQFPEAGAAFCRYQYIDMRGKRTSIRDTEMEKEGLLDNWLLRIAHKNRLQYVNMVVKRSVYERLGGFYGVTYGEDWEMWVRIARDYPVIYTPDILAEYRNHFGSISSDKLLTGQALRDIRTVMQFIEQYVPEDKKKQVMQQARLFWAIYGIRAAREVWRLTRSYKSTHSQVLEALQLNSSSIQVHLRILKLYLKIALETVKPPPSLS
ncbi:hypothetical protein GCM10023189_32070 [Nibrella saemangeumensis]|uniref:Glycosyltransferase 2-like domain-containing protein n=2 Tax=Nibrella saemangeumensis TaxID=1084526 RepID=A0ABP8N021_9BACT